MRARQRQQHDFLHQERAKFEVTLTIKETNGEEKEVINIMSPREITETCRRKNLHLRHQITRNQQTRQRYTHPMRNRRASRKFHVIGWGEVFERN